jgi:hypothetical protein
MSVLTIENLSAWNYCPVFLPFSPHTISTVTPAYLGILILFLIFAFLFFLYLYEIFEGNFHRDVQGSMMLSPWVGLKGRESSQVDVYNDRGEDYQEGGL